MNGKTIFLIAFVSFLLVGCVGSVSALNYWNSTFNQSLVYYNNFTTGKPIVGNILLNITVGGGSGLVYNSTSGIIGNGGLGTTSNYGAIAGMTASPMACVANECENSTFNIWVKLTTFANWQVLWNQVSARYIQLENTTAGAYTSVDFRTNAVNPVQLPGINQWIMYSIVTNTTHTCFYYNAVKKVCYTYQNDQTTAVVNILCRPQTASAQFMCDEFSVYNRTLPLSELESIYNSGSAVSYGVYAPPASDTCTYSGSGNWAMSCSDNCTISANVALGGNNMTIIGGGNVTLNANITNVKYKWIYGVSSSNRCTVTCARGCFQ